MIVSVNWLKKFVEIDMPVDELVALIGARLVEVEGVEDLSKKYKDVTVARVVSSEEMENSDHLNVVLLDDGGVVAGVERDSDGFVQVVCGAPNVRTNMLVAWLPPKSVVPETFGTDEPFVLSARPLRGYMSNGMIASARELDLYDEHDGILGIDKSVAPGSSFAQTYELDDTLIDIENKSLTHRPDAFGIIGLAREIAGIQGKQFKTPEWLQDTTSEVEPEGSIEAPGVHIEDADLSERFQLIVLDDIKEQLQSSVQMQTYLARSGVRPVSAVVDISNYLMLLTGQPTHMYDYDKLKAIAGDDFTVGVRLARSGEALKLLDGKDAVLDEADIVITAGDTPIGLAGIMGGGDTAVDVSTKTAVLEVATFNLYHMRSSQMRHGVFSEAVTRYTKGIPAELGRPVLRRAVAMAGELTGATAASAVVDEYPGVRESQVVEIENSRVNGLLGAQFSTDDTARLLENVEFKVTFKGVIGEVAVPYWRNDIHIPEDVAEEIGRLSGFDSISATMPTRDFTAVHPSRSDAVREALRGALVKTGMNEVLTYSFVHGDLLKKAGQDTGQSYRIVNSISPDLQYYRQSLQPSLLQHINSNVRLGYEQFGLFEFNKVHERSLGMTDESVPVEHSAVALVVTDAKNVEQTPYYQAKHTLEYMVASIGVKVSYESLYETQRITGARESVFEPKRSAFVLSAEGSVLGIVGEYKRSAAKAFKLPVYSAGFELSTDILVSEAPLVPVSYTPLSRYPGVGRDICFKVLQSVSYAQVVDAVQAALKSVPLEVHVDPYDIYAPDSGGTKNITVRLTFVSHEKTLTSEEVNEVVRSISEYVTEITKGEVV